MHRIRSIGHAVAAAFAAAVLTAAAAAHAQETGDLDRLRERALDLVNSARREHGLSPLTAGDHLAEAAQRHAADMLERDYYAHVTPEGDTVMDRYVAAGGNRWELVAENIARCRGCASPPTEASVENLQQGWMNSPEHRENILRPGLARFGFGIVVGDDRTLYAVQDFAGPGRPRDAQAAEDLAAIPSREQTAVALQRINKARTSAGRPPVEADDALVRAASHLLAGASGDGDGLSLNGNLMAALPENARGEWRKLSALAARCGGCGTEPTAADARSFVQQWLDDATYRERLLDPDLTRFGLDIGTNGTGRKDAVAVLGQRR